MKMETEKYGLESTLIYQYHPEMVMESGNDMYL